MVGGSEIIRMAGDFISTIIPGLRGITPFPLCSMECDILEEHALLVLK